MRKKFLPLALALVPAVPLVARAGGFELTYQSPAAAGVAGAQTARAEDSAAVYYNPAGLAFQKGMNVIAGADIYRVDVKESLPAAQASSYGGAASASSGVTLAAPTLFISQRLGSHFAAGLGVYSNFGEKIIYPTTWAGRFSGTLLDLQSVTINPSIAVRPHPRIAIGFGLDIIPGSVELRRALNFGGSEGGIQVGVSGVAVGGNFGALFILIPQYLNIGVAYRSAAQLDMTGTAAVTAPTAFASAAGKQNASAGITLPHNINVGVSSRPVSRLTLSFDMRWTLWRDLKSLDLSTVAATAPAGTTPTVTRLDLEWRDALSLRGGAEFRLLKAQNLALRAGLGYDFTPVPSSTLGPLTPDNDRMIVSVGLGYRWRMIGFDAAYVATIITKRTSQNVDVTNTSDGLGNVISLAFTLQLDHILTKHIAPAYRAMIGPDACGDCGGCGNCKGCCPEKDAVGHRTMSMNDPATSH